MAKNGLRNVTVNVFVGPTSTINLKYIRYAIALQTKARAAIFKATDSVIDPVGGLIKKNGNIKTPAAN